MDNEKTTITISRELKERLDMFGKKSDTYEDIILRILLHLEKNKVKLDE